MAKEKKNLNTLDVDSLSKSVNEKREALRAFRFSLSGSKVKNIKEGRTIRKDIARLLTEINSQKKSVTIK